MGKLRVIGESIEHYRPDQDGTLRRYYRSASDWTPCPRGGTTVCTLSVAEEGSDEVLLSFAGVSTCSKHDSFCYRRGREIARGRAYKEYKLATGQYRLNEG